MSLFDQFYRVKAHSEVFEKAAMDGARPSILLAKLALWKEAKSRADRSSHGRLVGLMAEALSVWGDSQASGVKTAAAVDEALPFAASFAAAAVVDDMIAAKTASGELSKIEAVKLAAINAEAAFDDLEKVAFGIGDLLNLAKQHPQVAGMMVGGAVGAGVGALNDGENPARGAAAGASLGAAVGSLGGQVGADWTHGAR